jgi:hypothetical protein
MNIFAVHNDPVQAAQDLPDKLVVKMPTESLQMLTPFCYNRFGIKIPKEAGGFYGVKGFAHHPCSKWLYQSESNVIWLWIHAYVLCAEYTLRYKKTHAIQSPLKKIYQLLDLYNITPSTCSWTKHTPFVQAMPEEAKIVNDPVTAYRGYLMDYKGYCEWKHSNPPLWWNEKRFAKIREEYLSK